MSTSTNRRKFLKTTAAATFGFQVVPSTVFGANSKVQLACVGVGGKGSSDIAGNQKAGATVVGLCDVDRQRLAGSANKYAGAKTFTDFREMYESLGDKFDAVTVSTPDHTHFHASLHAIRRGKHVYCQKPLTHSAWEARTLTEAAAKAGVVTQMGNQAHAGEPIRRGVELVRAGLLGKVREVHAWTNRPIWPQGMAEALPEQPVPEHLDWDQWIGPAPMRPYNAGYAHFKWRGWWDFGTGALGHMACHIMDMPFWALDLKYPETISATSEGATGQSGPTKSCVTYTFPAGKYNDALTYKWWDGMKQHPDNMPPAEVFEGTGIEGRGAQKFDLIMIGEKGKLLFNRNSTRFITSPGNLIADLGEVEQSVPRVKDEDQEWIDAIQGKGGEPLSGFNHSGPFTEIIVLGNLAVRLGKKLDWDGPGLKATNAPEADPLIRRAYRSGWEV